MRTLIIFLLLTTSVLAAPKPTPTPEPISRADLYKTLEHVQALATELQADLEAEKLAELAVGRALSIATMQNEILQKQIQAQTDKLNKVQDKLDAAVKKLWWYRLHFFLGWIILGTGIIACIIFAFLKFTGRLAVAAAPIAAKVP